MDKRLPPILVVLLFSLIFFLAYNVKTTTDLTKACHTTEIFVSPELACDEDPSADTKALKNTVEDLVDKYLANNTAEKVSIFYRDLANRQWFGINENVPFSPGSLLKLPLAIAFYKLSEIDEELLERQFEYRPTNMRPQNIPPHEKLMAGRAYSVEELIARMIKDSDNEAVSPLYNAINKDFLDKVYIDLGVYIPITGGLEQDFVSVKTYGAILRSLYNASYLNRSGSNELLSIMSQSTFRDGIAAGLPGSVKLANKFGELSIIAGDTLAYVELHDCGVVYAPTSPYALCIMTKGQDFDALAQAIAEISKTVYENR